MKKSSPRKNLSNLNSPGRHSNNSSSQGSSSHNNLQHNQSHNSPFQSNINDKNINNGQQHNNNNNNPNQNFTQNSQQESLISKLQTPQLQSNCSFILEDLNQIAKQRIHQEICSLVNIPSSHPQLNYQRTDHYIVFNLPNRSSQVQ